MLKLDQVLEARDLVARAGFAVLEREMQQAIAVVAPLPDKIVTVTIRRESEPGAPHKARDVEAWAAERLRLHAARTPSHCEGVATFKGPDEAQTDAVLERTQTDLPSDVARAAAGAANAAIGPRAVEATLRGIEAVQVPVEVAQLASELGLVLVPSHRGIEAHRGNVREFCEVGMDKMHGTLLRLRTRELEEMMK